jgi:ketopantoate hydroxymethyltransferase
VASEKPAPRITPFHFNRQKQLGGTIAMVTAYDAPSAMVAEAAGIDGILVGDSAAMVMLGHDSTVQITVDEMVILARCRAASTGRSSSPTCRSDRSRCRTRKRCATPSD